jgi:hypothetical protein
MWPPIKRAYRWVHCVAHLLAHPGRRRSRGMRRAMQSLVEGRSCALPAVGPLRGRS